VGKSLSPYRIEKREVVARAHAESPRSSFFEVLAPITRIFDFTAAVQSLRPSWRQSLPTLLAAALTILLWAFTPITTRIATFQLDGVTVGMVRTVGAGVLALPVILVLRLRPPREWRHWRSLLLSAFGGFVLFPLLFSMGTRRTSACHAGLIMAMMPLFTCLIGNAVKRQWFRPQWALGAGIAIAGEILLVAGAHADAAAGGHSSLAGDALVLVACLAAAVSFVAGASLTETIGAWASTFWAILLASIVLAPWAALHTGRIALAELSPGSWAALIHLTLGAGFLAWVAWFWALSRGGIARVAVLQFCQPLLSLVFAGVLLSEPLTAPLLVSAAAILTGVVVARRAESVKRQRRADLWQPGSRDAPALPTAAVLAGKL
jgi:drug/metabolite transporter (DMT)-like permease